MMAGTSASEKGGGRVEDLGLLFEYTIKLLLLASFLELVLYRLLSRLGMHLSKVAAKYEAVRILFKGLSSIGFTLLNFVSLLVFLAISLVLLYRMNGMRNNRCDALLIPSVALLLALTVVFLIAPPSMLGSIAYNIVTAAVLIILAADYVRTHPLWIQRITISVYLLGVFGWLYYQTISTVYGYLGIASIPPLAHEVNRAGEAMMVLASILAFWAYGGVSLRTKNKRQRWRTILFVSLGGALFIVLLFLDYFLVLYDKEVAESVRKAGEGIGWIFQMGMGYTFYLPFALYVAGLLCWGYAVLKQLSMGRLAGYGLGLMFMAGYALQLSHLTLMVALGWMLLCLDKRRATSATDRAVEERSAAGAASSLVGERISSA